MGYLYLYLFYTVRAWLHADRCMRLLILNLSLRATSNRFLVPSSFSQFLGFVCTFPGPSKYTTNHVLFCSLAVLDQRVGHTTDVLSPFIPVICHSESCSRFDVVRPGRAWSSSPACTWHCSVFVQQIILRSKIREGTKLQFTNSDRKAAAQPVPNHGFTFSD